MFMRLPHATFLVASILASLGLQAQDVPETPADRAAERTSSSRIPPDINGMRTIIPSPEKPRALKVAIYEGPGSGASGVDNVEARAKQIEGTTVTRIKPEEMATVDLSAFDLVVFSGGSGSKQGGAIGEAGRANIRRYVENGGGYLGICAGAYLALSNYSWSLGLLNGRTVSPKWRRGTGFMDVELSEEGRGLFGAVEGTFKCRYANGPIIKPMGREDLPAYEVAAWFRSEVALNDSPAGVMVNSPAAAYAPFGKGRVFILSPHPENTPGLENMVPRAMLWLAGQGEAPAARAE